MMGLEGDKSYIGVERVVGMLGKSGRMMKRTKRRLNGPCAEYGLIVRGDDGLVLQYGRHRLVCLRISSESGQSAYAGKD